VGYEGDLRRFLHAPQHQVFQFFLPLQIWALCDPLTGYLSKFEVYQGKRQKNAEKNVGENVVLRLSAHLPPGTCIAADRFFGTLALVMRLIDCGKWFIGTVMGNSEGLPAELNRGKSGKGLQRGQSVARYLVYKGVQIWTTLWYDTKPVNLLHTIGSPASYSGTAMRWVKNTAASGFKRVTYWCPSAYIIYNQMMGGVDTFDHYRAMYTVSLIVKSRWTVYLFMWTVEAAICNAYILYSQNPNVPKLSHSQFRESLCFDLMREGLPYRRRVAGGKKKLNPARHVGFHSCHKLQDLYPGTTQLACVVCHANIGTCCKQCEVTLCIEPRDAKDLTQNCYSVYHDPAINDYTDYWEGCTKPVPRSKRK